MKADEKTDRRKRLNSLEDYYRTQTIFLAFFSNTDLLTNSSTIPLSLRLLVIATHTFHYPTSILDRLFLPFGLYKTVKNYH